MNIEILENRMKEANAIFRRSEPLKKYTSLKIGGIAQFYIKPNKIDDIDEIIKFLKSEDIKFKILGNGTNLLISDGFLNFGVLHILNLERKTSIEGEFMEVTADNLLRRVAYQASKNSLSGFEELSYIPGTVGGAISMNAGAFGKEIFDIVDKVEIVDFNGKSRKLEKGEIQKGYRFTNIKYIGVVKNVKFKLTKDEEKKIREREKEYLKERELKQPLRERTCGSVFKNSKEFYAGALLERLGFKGRRKGRVRFSEKHSNFLVAEEGATFEEAYSLIEEAREKAFKEGFSLDLELEVWKNDD